MKTPKTYVSLCGLLFAVFLGLLAYKIADPWQYRHDDNGAWFSAIARSHVIRGLGETKGQDFFLRRDSDTLQPYLHHPPLLGLYLAGVFWLTGQDSPFMARAAIGFVHVLSFLLFILMARKVLQDTRARLWAFLVFAIAPASVFFGKMPNHEPLALVFLLGGCYSYLRHRQALSGHLWMGVGAVFFSLAGFTSWHALFVVAGVALHGLLSGQGSAKSFGRMSLAVCLLTPLLVIAHIAWADDRPFLSGFKGALDHWFLSPYFSRYFTNIYKGWKYTMRYSGHLPMIFATIWIGALAVRAARKDRPVSWQEGFTASLAFGTVVFSLVFANALQAHAYMQFFLLPFYALASAFFVFSVYDGIAARHRALASLFLAAVLALTVFFSVKYFLYIYSAPYDYSVQTARHLALAYY